MSAPGARRFLVTQPVRSIDQLDWSGIEAQLDFEGYAVLPGLLGSDEACALRRWVDQAAGMRSRSLADRDLGRGGLFDLGEPLPVPLAAWRDAFYRRLASIANRWNEALDLDYRYPAELAAFLERNRESGQVRPQSRLSRLREGDYLALHQLGQGTHVFPLQVVALLSEPGRDFAGGEFIMTEQRPRLQSRPMVLPLRSGDAAVITTAHRPFKGSGGWYRVNLRHAVGRVRSGERIGLELAFHDAP